MDPWVAGAELDAAHVASSIDGQRQDEDAREIRALGWKHERCRQRHDQIWRAEMPAVGQGRRFRKVASIAFTYAVRDPALKNSDLGFGQRIQTDELMVGRICLPR